MPWQSICNGLKSISSPVETLPDRSSRYPKGYMDIVHVPNNKHPVQVLLKSQHHPTRQHQIFEYLDLPLGSGMVESACK